MMNADVWEDILQKDKDDRNMQRNTDWITLKGRKGGWASLDGRYDRASEIEEMEDEEFDRDLFGG